MTPPSNNPNNSKMVELEARRTGSLRDDFDEPSSDESIDDGQQGWDTTLCAEEECTDL
jgi:hypothetical protein